MAGALPALLSDIGGTNARFALLDSGRITDIRTLPAAEYESISAAARAYLEGRAIYAAALAVAGPVTEENVSLTNRSWSFARRSLADELGVDSLHVINDFTAQALALPYLGEDDLRVVGTLSNAPPGPKAVLGPGTGLGVSGLIPTPSGWQALTTEGGHVTLPATTEKEEAVIRLLRARYGHVSAERVLSGAGLSDLSTAIAEIDGLKIKSRPPDKITAAASAGEPLAVATVGMFGDFLATVAADLALSYGATGGVYIAGGIIPRLGGILDASRFRARFEDKGRFAGFLEAIPSFVVTAAYPALTGLKSLLDARERLQR